NKTVNNVHDQSHVTSEMITSDTTAPITLLIYIKFSSFTKKKFLPHLSNHRNTICLILHHLERLLIFGVSFVKIVLFSKLLSDRVTILTTLEKLSRRRNQFILLMLIPTN